MHWVTFDEMMFRRFFSCNGFLLSLSHATGSRAREKGRFCFLNFDSFLLRVFFLFGVFVC